MYNQRTGEFTFELILLKERYLMKTKQPWLLILILVFGLLLTGCGSNASPTPNTAQMTEVMQRVQSTLTQIAVEALFPDVEPTFTPTSVPPTKTPQPEPMVTNTPMPTVQPPTPTPLPSVAYVPPEVLAEVRVTLEPYTNTISVVGMVKSYTMQRYTFKASEGNLVDISFISLQANKLSILGSDGTVLLNPADGSQHFQGYLPSTQDWFVDIKAEGSNIDFWLFITIK